MEIGVMNIRAFHPSARADKVVASFEKARFALPDKTVSAGVPPFFNPATKVAVIPAQAGIQCVDLISSKINQMHDMDSGLRRNDGWVIDCPLNIKGGSQFPWLFHA